MDHRPYFEWIFDLEPSFHRPPVAFFSRSLIQICVALLRFRRLLRCPLVRALGASSLRRALRVAPPRRALRVALPHLPVTPPARRRTSLTPRPGSSLVLLLERMHCCVFAV